jgi:hypothetical protein
LAASSVFYRIAITHAQTVSAKSHQQEQQIQDGSTSSNVSSGQYNMAAATSVA